MQYALTTIIYSLSHNICFLICSGSSQSSTLQLVWRRLGFSSSNDYSKPPSASANQPEVVLVGNDLYGSNNSYGKYHNQRFNYDHTIHFLCVKQILGYHDRHNRMPMVIINSSESILGLNGIYYNNDSFLAILSARFLPFLANEEFPSV